MSLVDEAVQAATAAYVSSLEVPEGTRLLNLRVYFDGDDAGQLAPPSITVPGRVDLDEPDAGEHPALVALLDEINEHDDDALLEEYFAALTLSLHRALGVVVVVSGTDVSIGASPREQLGAQLSEAEWAEWKANDWLPRNRGADRLLESLDIVVAWPLDSGQSAVIYARDGKLYGDPHLFDVRFGRELTREIQTLGDQPAVLAGLLPDGAVSVSVQDLFDVWHEAQVARGAWLCVLPHEQRGPWPQVRFLDMAGEPVQRAATPKSQPFQSVSAGIALGEDPDWDAEAEAAKERAREQRVLESAKGLLLWPVDAPGPPSLVGRSSDGSDATTGVTLGHPQLTVRVSNTEVFARLGDLLEEWLGDVVRDPRERARIVLEAQRSKLPGRISGRKTTFEAIAAGGAWAAVRDPNVAVSGLGELPERLDLVKLKVGDVQPS